MTAPGTGTRGRRSPHGFSSNTRADFTPCAAPERESDFQSRSGSRYWYTDEGVYRESDHFGHGVRSCDWTLDGCGYGAGMHLWPDPASPVGFVADARIADEPGEVGVPVCGFCPWDGFVRKG